MQNHNRHPFHAAALMSAVLSQLVGSILIGVYVGKWLDLKENTDPLFLIIGLFLGLAVGVSAMLRMIHHYFSGD